VPGWATAITPGPGDPTQVLNFIVTNGNNPLFSSQPAVNALGALTFTTAPNKNGSAMVTISLHDNGGTANGGTDTSATQTFVINVTAVNDAPTFTKGADISLPEEASPVTHTVTNWATNFVPGPTDELSQTVLGYTVTNNANNLFSTQPTINTGGTLSYRLAANRNGTATVSVSVRDSGGTANGGVDTSSIQTFTITITGVDHAPAAITDSVTVIQGTGPNSIDALANDFDPDGDTITIIAVSQGAHGTTKIAADKLSVTYDPTGSYFGSDQFQYEITDGRLTAFGTVVVTVQKDTFAPVAAAPKIVTTATTGSTATIKIRWSGTDVGFGVKYYQLQESRNGGTYVSVTVPVGATSISRTVADGSTYRYRVRGVDQVGNVGTYVLSALYKPSEAPRSGPTNRTKA
ncbi:MAG TPA: Ig-like domain-containing protein, partial [Candidatus Limnocylindrales bacterium]